MSEQRFEVATDNEDVSGVRVTVEVELRPHADRQTLEGTLAECVRRVLLAADLPSAPEHAPRT